MGWGWSACGGPSAWAAPTTSAGSPTSRPGPPSTAITTALFTRRHGTLNAQEGPELDGPLHEAIPDLLAGLVGAEVERDARHQPAEQLAELPFAFLGFGGLVLLQL